MQLSIRHKNSCPYFPELIKIDGKIRTVYILHVYLKIILFFSRENVLGQIGMIRALFKRPLNIEEISQNTIMHATKSFDSNPPAL